MSRAQSRSNLEECENKKKRQEPYAGVIPQGKVNQKTNETSQTKKRPLLHLPTKAGLSYQVGQRLAVSIRLTTMAGEWLDFMLCES